jgi:hypothetical protein
MSVTRSTEQIVREEIAKAIEENTEKVTPENADQIFDYKISKTRVRWTIRCCIVCHKPNFIHQEPWDDNCRVQQITQSFKGEYIDQLENHKRMKQIAERMMPEEEEEEEDERMIPRNPRLGRSWGEKPKFNEKI